MATDSNVLVEDTCLQNVLERIRHRILASVALQHVKTSAAVYRVTDSMCNIIIRICVKKFWRFADVISVFVVIFPANTGDDNTCGP